MIKNINNKHIRRLALIGITPVIFILAPFYAIIGDSVAETFRQWAKTFKAQWNRV